MSENKVNASEVLKEEEESKPSTMAGKLPEKVRQKSPFTATGKVNSIEN
jgi:hypothetical protein